MSSQGNGQSGAPAYRVVLSRKDKSLLQKRHLEAIKAGTGERFLTAYRKIIERLRQAPLDFGEPLYRLPVLRLLVRQAMISPLVVDYAVHEEQPLVFIRGFKVLS